MKKRMTIAFILATILCSVSGFGQRNSMFTVSGVWERGGYSEISLYAVVSGRTEKVSTAYLQANRTFEFAHQLKTEGFYVIGGHSTNIGITERVGKYVFYFKPGDHLNLVVTDSSYRLVGENTNENIAMAAWHDYILTLERMSFYSGSFTYVDFFPAFEEKTAVPYEAKSTGNKAFDDLFAKFRRLDLMHNALNLITSLRSAHPEGEDFIDYYKTLKLADITANTDVLLFPFGHLISSVAYIEGRLGGPKVSDPIAMLEIAKSDTIKGELALNKLSAIRDLTVMNEFKTTHAKYIITDDQKMRMEKEYKRISDLYLKQGVGKPGHAFTYKDIAGKDVSFSDFKGKVVYVDVWATWCGPCRQQIPHMKALEKKYHGNNDIVFVSISSDAIKDIPKWKAFVAKEQLSGIQLHGRTTGNDDITKLYQISGIPRFLLFDKNGNIVSLDAPNPSSDELDIMLRNLLK